MKFMLDTNTCIALMRGNPKVVARMEALSPDDCAVSVITAYELFTGIAKCREPARERAKVARLLSGVRVLTYSSEAAKETAALRADLEKTGRCIGPYDVLLAGHALSLGLCLATHNTGEFSRVSGLQFEDWQG
ncbi:MAG TPA: type II toxin-antitoxin system VapC family toxin [Verrucomicrobiales bacterium]|jgi:tRNA(fMet)-specific endonuclease VapC|nr:type II toxin-antitoxin system VapC family toxin [Verrucomicrobiales bacterium]